MSAVPHLENRPFPVRTALVVDADPQVEAVLTGTLNPLGWCILHAPNNAAALALAEATPCDLILTSEKTSGKDDIELLRKIPRVRPHPQAPPRIHLIASQSKQYFSNGYWRRRFFRQAKFTKLTFASGGLPSG